MNKTEYFNEKIGEKYTVATHKSGLKIHVCEKKAFSAPMRSLEPNTVR